MERSDRAKVERFEGWLQLRVLSAVRPSLQKAGEMTCGEERCG